MGTAMTVSLSMGFFNNFDLEIFLEIRKKGFTVEAFRVAVLQHPSPNGLDGVAAFVSHFDEDFVAALYTLSLPKLP